MAHPVDVELRDGSTVRVRPVHVNDAPALGRFLRGLSDDARRYRFFGNVDAQAAADRMVRADGTDHHGLVAVTGNPPRIVGHAEYLRRPGEPVAEAAFAVSDARQGRGLGTLLLAHLAERASAVGIRMFEAEVMRGNRRMVGMFRASGFPTEVRAEEGEHRVTFPTSLSPDAIEAFERRESVSAVALVDRLLRPASVAVIGASRRPGTVGAQVLRRLREGRYGGAVYPVNRNADTVQGIPALRGAGDLPEGVDLAVVAVPAAAVAQVARECGARGVRTLVVLSAGFAEVGGAGAARQADLLEACRANGMRLVGPNCLGVLNTAPDARLNVTFSGPMPPAGNVGMVSQSGGLGIALLEGARELGIGISAFVSVGNKADISGNDMLRHWAADTTTDVVLLYLESFGNPRAFARVARRVSQIKPVVAMKAGRGAAGARAAASHTGALVAGSDATVDALFAKTGVIRARTVSELFDITRLLSSQPLPAGRRVGIITNVGGPGILCADACEDGGLEVVELSAAARERLATFALPGAALGNPVDLLAGATAEQFGQAVRVLGAGEVDAVIVLYIEPGLGSAGPEVAGAVREAAGALAGVPVVLVLMSDADRTAVRADARPGDPPVYAYPEAAAGALARAADYTAWRRRSPGTVPRFEDARPARAAAVLSRATVAGRRWLEADELTELLGAYGLPLAPMHPAGDARDAADVAAGIEGSVALKAVAPGLVHRSDVGGVRVGLAGAEAVAVAARQMTERLTAAGYRPTGFVVQPMAPAGVEVLVGAVGDPQFGPVLACGAGGVAAEVQRDVAVRLAPLTDVEAGEMVRGLRLSRLLAGYRGTPAADVAALEDVLLRVGTMVHAHPQIVEIDCNPVVVSPAGAVIVDARVRVADAPSPVPWPSLRAAPPLG